MASNSNIKMEFLAECYMGQSLDLGLTS